MKMLFSIVLGFVATLVLSNCSSTKVSSQDLKAPFIDHRSEIESCYAKVLKKEPDLGGGVAELKFLINEEGQAYKTVFLKKKSTLNSKLLNACIKRTVATWQFPKGQKLEVVYPFQFEVANANLSDESNTAPAANDNLDVINTSPAEGDSNSDVEATPAE